MTPKSSIGERVPQVTLGRVSNGAVTPISLRDELAGKRAMLIGVPGAFTPVCTHEHVPSVIANVERLRAAGITAFYCVTPDNPWVTEAWARDVDPAGRLTFLSDGNLALARALGVTITDHDHCLGETSTRYMLVTDNGMVRRLTAEPHFASLTCTRAQDAEVVFID